MLLSLFAVLIVFLAMPASLALVDSWNNAISNEYETFIEFNNKTCVVNATVGGIFRATGGFYYSHYNSSNSRIDTKETVYDKSLFDDANYEAILSTTDQSDSNTYRDMVFLSLNVTASELLKSGATTMRVHFDAGKPIYLRLRYQNKDSPGFFVMDKIELNSSTNYTVRINIEKIKLIEAENAEEKGHFTLEVSSYNETSELSPGDVVKFDWQFMKKKGAVATIYTVDNLMFAWGAILFLIGFASTPFFNPLSRDKFPFITKIKKSRAAKRAAEKRSRSRRKSPRSSKKKRRRR